MRKPDNMEVSEEPKIRENDLKKRSDRSRVSKNLTIVSSILTLIGWIIMCSKYRLIFITFLIFILLTPSAMALQMAEAPIPGDWAYVSGIVTYNGKPQDGVLVTIPGGTMEGSSFTTRDGGYYKVSAYPGLAVSIKVSHRGASMTRSVETGGESSNTTYNFDLTAVEPSVSVTPVTVPETIVLVGSVKHDGSPVQGVFVNVSPVTRVKTDMSGQFMATVTLAINLTISAETPAGLVSKTVTSPAEGTSFAVDLTSTSPEPTATVTPTPMAPTSLPATPTAAPAGSEVLIVLSAISLLAAAGLSRHGKN